jgi:hypothetical protein
VSRGRRILTAVVAAGTVMVGATLATTVAAGAGGSGPSDLSKARAAASRYHSFGQAERAGYGMLADAAGITCIEHHHDGGMGTHFVKGALVGDGLVDAGAPEALLYDMSGPTPRLLGLEYVVLEADWKGGGVPRLFDREFTRIDENNRYGLPPFYELHVWLWEDNPAGMFADYNPRVGC